MHLMSDNAISISSRAFCTIITKSHIPFAQALYSSISNFHDNFSFFALVVDADSSLTIDAAANFFCLTPADLIQSASTQKLFDKYQVQSKGDELRWALKPALLRWLLDTKADKVVYVDADIFFVGSVDFLFDDLEKHTLLLTPHWYISTPGSDDFRNLFTSGYFNAGFAGASKNAVAILQWWEEACFYKMEKSSTEGLYDDQRYLDLVPFLFENVGVITHRGCNLANWNLDTNIRELIDGRLLISGRFEPKFIHFTYETIQRVILGHDGHLLSYLNDYKRTFGPAIFDEHFSNLETLKSNWYLTIKRKLLIRTRFKRFMYRLLEKI